MRVSDIKKVKPSKENIVIKKLEQDKTGGLFVGAPVKDDKNAELSFSEVVAIGPMATQPEQCPGLEIGDKIVHNRFSGSYIGTKELDALYKVMDGYSVMAILEDINNINENTIHPTSNRLLVAVKFLDETDEGLYIPSESASDPSLEDLAYGTVIKVGPSCKLTYNVGDIVAYPPYCGEEIRKAESGKKPALRVLVEEDVLLSI
jgi:co-chaperonin GroES (HSP10)